MHAVVNLAHVIIGKNGGVAGVRRVVGSTVVEGAARGEGQPCLEAILLDELAVCVLDHVADLQHSHAGLDVATEVLAGLWTRRAALYIMTGG